MSSTKQTIRQAVYNEHRTIKQEFNNQKANNVKTPKQLEINPRLLISYTHTHTPASVLEYSEIMMGIIIKFERYIITVVFRITKP